MKRATFFLGLLFYFQTGCFGNPVPEQEPIISIHRVFNYHGEINATNSADNETVSRWTVSGKLSVYSAEGRTVLKLDELKTSLFNGLQSELHHVQEKEIPEEAKVIFQPFEVKRHDVENTSINFLPNEPLWSQNFKRGIANNLDLEVDLKNIREAENNPGFSIQETTLYGRCDVQYNKVKFDDEIVLERSFRHASCEKSSTKSLPNRFSRGYVEDYESKTVKTTTLLDRNGTTMVYHMVTVTHLQPKSFLATAHLQYIDQLVKLDLLDYKESTSEIPIDTSKMTDKRELIYEVGDEPTSGRHSYDTSVAGLTKQYLDNADKFEKYFIHSPLQHIDLSKYDAVENMFLVLQRLDFDGLKHLETTMAERGVSNDTFNMYATLLPYVGTHATIKIFLKRFLEEKPEGRNEMLLQKFMTVFPMYVENYTEELLEELEPLMKIDHYDQQSTNNAGILCFASAVYHAGRHGALTKTKSVKYTKLYIQKFMESETYQERMLYLLGLINMDDMFDLHLMNHIITNTTEHKHLRALALAGFKHNIVLYSDVKELYNMYWPIVQNNKEPFEVRVGALDLLLSVNLSDEQFNTIIKKYSLHLNDPQEKHLANYLLTSLHSLQNTTHFKDPVGAKAFEALKNNNIPGMTRFTTGNYRLAHSDKNIGAYLQARVISDPSTNIIDTIQVNYKSYGYNFEFNGYSLYLKIEGLFGSLYINEFLKKLKYMDDISAVPELLAALKKNNFEITSTFGKQDFHIDIVIFKDNTAVYASHFDKFGKFAMMQPVNDYEEFLTISLNIQFPLANYVQMPSDLGTHLQFSNVVEDFSYQNVNDLHKEIKYRSTWNYQSWIESYNPFVDTNIATYKYTGIDNNLHLNYAIKKDDYMFSWKNMDNSFMMYTDNIMGTSVEDEDLLKQYCEKCEAYIDVPLECTMDLIKKFEPLGLKINITKEGNTEDSCVSSLGDTALEYFMTNEDYEYKSNTDASPKAWAIMYLTHVYNHKMLFVDDLSRSSYNFLPLYDESIETGMNVDVDMIFKVNTLDPISRKVVNCTIQMDSKIVNHTEVSSSWKANYKLVMEPEYTDDTGKKFSAYFVTLNVKNDAASDDNSNSSYKICAKRELFFPSIRSDKYSLLPVEPSTGKLVWTYSNVLEGEDGVCTPNKVLTVTDTVSATDKAEKLKIKQNKEDYDECIENSKDLHFTAPTSACKRISARLAEYDNYKTGVTVEQYPEEEGGEIEKSVYKEPAFTFSREGNDYMKVTFRKEEDGEFLGSFEKTIYYPEMLNPLAIAYMDCNNVIPFFATTKCTIAPSTIEHFSGKYTPNQNKEWLAFAECYNVTKRGLTGHTIDKNHVGFTYRSSDTVLTATVKEGKMHVELDGKELHKSFTPEDSEYKLYFLADNVINFSDDRKVNIYYNTEYVQVTANALYTKLLCGVCTQDQ